MWSLISWSIEKRGTEMFNSNAICYYDGADKLVESAEIARSIAITISFLTLMSQPTLSA